ncbi:proline dehydrogenase family protein [Cellulomonas fimi]|uniref:L-glutamate gamma-semialdehyde dehydrogenase n=1 Tax=Cellulomonas fimi (strain ATCC 484 / DSM 20113 / JCM 1341 / CCUG 24087 / LMG 16345 / NBRC 15513 / NCIMB 8980 / NCTC 7547 / NRS-133) TaxID=590998 RepID=F4H469_CELFA|nr:proline dehydrogenase family protein [Cellulomonas fimi]AEE45421.1 Aldehyde Dehydrogenase [Cellulomonas fimi ATCC 484]NNH06826.1 aldehyde dehydrogenase family protein [Cellulomonas fimi]VEH29340.1 Bifunctional protein putA [Cellulomonas fimi]
MSARPHEDRSPAAPGPVDRAAGDGTAGTGTDGAHPAHPALPDEAVRLARRWLERTSGGETRRERSTTRRLAALVGSPEGLELAVRFVDRVARPRDVRVAARELARLTGTPGAAAFLGPADRVLLAAGARVAPALPGVVVPAARRRLRALVGHLVVDDGPALARHLAATRADGYRLNLNLLGEAVLGEHEATARLARVRALVERPDVDYVSVKVSAVASQLSPWDFDGSVDRVVERLLPLYEAAARHGTFVNLDMEEYRDLALTVRVFERLASHPPLAQAAAGIALQAYLPDAAAAYDEIAEVARRRVTAGGAPLKVRLVKGANLAMERVEAELHGWPQAPYPTKADVDAAYLRLVDRSLRPERTAALRVGVASHNVFHVAAAHLLAQQRGVSEALDVEMLQGMAPAQARAVRDDVGSVLLYTPVVAPDEFDVAVSYLVRRLEENAAGENFLHAAFADAGGDAMDGQERAFRDAWEARDRVSTTPRRGTAAPVPPARPGEAVADAAGTDPATPARPGEAFANVPDTDPATPEGRRWAREVVARDVAPAPGAVVAGAAADVDALVERARGAADAWASTDPSVRATALRAVARALEEARTDLVAVMVHEAGKTVAEADPEVSEAVDFARYYAERAQELADGHVPGARFRPRGVTVVTPPWNFPVAIPVGSVLAALAAGSPVLVKPAPATPLCARVAMAAVRAGLDAVGAPADVLTVVLCPEGDVGRRLVTHPAVARVLLTGSIETARAFASWREDLDVLAETSGKNALVITPSADVDLAVADLVRSAFGHAGQKCSAASLAILVGSAGTDERLRHQLADAVSSLRVGHGQDLGTVMGPVVEPAQGKLLRALTTLDPGEEWLVAPRQVDTAGRLWTPGVKHGVAPGSWFHRTECFGPVLGIMRARDLEEAIAWQNAVAFGLTGGLHSLDEAEIATWLERVEVGNAYVNRHTTGAVVRRQPFGGWKASVVGPGAKAGGPHYVAQLGDWSDAPDVPQDDDAWLAWARDDDARVWAQDLGAEHDPSGLHVEENVLRYRPVPHLTVRAGDGARPAAVARVVHAARTAGVPTTVSDVAVEGHADFAARVRAGAVTGRVRVVGDAPGLRAAAAEQVGAVTVLDAPVLASASRELLTVVREQAVSRTRHRFGHVTDPVRRATP